MKTQILFYPFLILGLFLTACKNNSETTLASADQGNEPNCITFKVDGVPVKTSGWNISRFKIGEEINLNVTTNMHDDKRTVMLNLRGSAPGKYSLDEGASGKLSGYGDYKPDYTNLLESYRFVQGNFIIQSIDTAKCLLNATFFGKVEKGTDILSITDGKIVNGSIRKSIDTY